MVGASKILTVSYGTFSCTLEGFDEPFNTMKAIAEYFRDLAAEDRYFGAEPPTPDADMLHRIAEREIQRRVDAKIDANGVILRPRQIEEEAPQAAAVSVSEAAPAPAAPVVEPVVDAAPAAIDPVSESVAAKLQRIRAAVAQARAAASAAPGYEDDEFPDALPVGADAAPDAFGYELDLSGPLQGEDEQAPETDAISPAEDEVVAETIVAEADIDMPDMEISGIMAAAFAEADDEIIADEDAVTEEEVVAAEEDAAEDETGEALEWNDDEGAPAAPHRRPESVVARRRASRQAARATALASAAAELAEMQAAEEPVTALAGDMPAAEMQEAPEADMIVALADDTEETCNEVSEFAAETASAEEAPVVEGSIEEDEVDLAETLAASLSDETPAGMDAPETLILAHVVKLPREDAGPVDAEAPLLLTPAQDEVDDLAAALSSDDDTDLMRDLASLEATAETEAAAAPEDDSWAANLEEDDELSRLLSGMAEDEAPALAEEEMAAEDQVGEELIQTAEAEDDTAEADEFVAENAEETTEEDAPQAADPAPVSESDAREADVSRLIEETNTKLEGAENRRRFSAIAHLKAAVAATVADRLVRGERNGRTAKEEEAAEAYRDDLTHAVQPRRPVASGEAHTLRPALPQARPAPLMLVSEQRIDRADDEDAVVRPRRISATRHSARPDAEDAAPAGPISAEDARSFAEFAESLGSSGLSELLEAAAAYTSTIEGRPHFSPPQILRKVASVADEGDFSREESLRSFGQLLRQGKIAKIRRGQYAITEQSRFFEETRRAAN